MDNVSTLPTRQKPNVLDHLVLPSFIIRTLNLSSRDQQSFTINLPSIRPQYFWWHQVIKADVIYSVKKNPTT